MTSSKLPIVLDSSVIVAILTQEPDAEAYEVLVNSAQRLLVGAPTLVEASMVLISRLGPESGMIALLKFLTRSDCEVIDFTRLHFLEAATAFQKYGKGRHSAALNMGDCNSYATAKVAGAALLYKGDDFALTDLPKLTPPA
jgi:ribonuclease VapC